MAKLDCPGFEKYLSAFDFPRLFADMLGWNHASYEAAWANDTAGDTPFSRRTVAEMGGMVAIQVVVHTSPRRWTWTKPPKSSLPPTSSTWNCSATSRA